MHTIMEVIEANKGDVTMLDYCFKLVGFIAFRKDNVQLIVQQDGPSCSGLECFFSLFFCVFFLPSFLLPSLC